jgi:coenzyme F420-reducing hydrogenase beta subunit
MTNIAEIKGSHFLPECTGCGACSAACPSLAIRFIQDAEGFYIPEIDYEKCRSCGVCIKACPAANKKQKSRPLVCYAAKNRSEQIRLKSSSGGVFHILAEEILDAGGVVFGASFNNDWEIVHDYIESIDDISKFHGSKYVQSWMGDSYRKCKNFLDAGRNVLFSGVPCQIAALKQFLGKDYENLLTVDLVCHGVPSPGVWKKYIDELTSITPPPPSYDG